MWWILETVQVSSMKSDQINLFVKLDIIYGHWNCITWQKFYRSIESTWWLNEKWTLETPNGIVNLFSTLGLMRYTAEFYKK